MINTGMSNDEARESLEALALGALAPDERDAVLAVVAKSPELSGELEALQAAASDLAYLVRPVSMSSAQRDRIRARLLGRATGDRGQAPLLTPAPATPILMPFTTHPTPPQTHLPTGWMTSPASWIAMAASIAAVAALALMNQATQERDKIARLYAAVSTDRVTGVPAMDSLRGIIADRDRDIENLTGAHVAVVSLAANSGPAISALMFWNQPVNAWTFVAHNMPAPKPGRTYQLWLITNSSQKISAGTFKPGRGGDVTVRATYTLPREALSAVAVTDEPEAGSTQPTTLPVIAGTRSLAR